MPIHQLLIDVLTASSVLLIGAVGLYLVFGLYRIVNMAHGEFVLLGGYLAAHFQSQNMPFLVGALLSGVVVAGLSLVIDKLLIGRLRKSSSLSPLLATWGIGIVIAQSIRLVLGPAGVAVSDPVDRSVTIMGSAYSGYHISLVVVATVLIFLIWFVIHRMPVGLQIRAQTNDETLAELNGVNTRLQFSLIFCCGGFLAGLAGALLAPLASINPASGSGLSISSFMVVIVGGMNHVVGQVIGAGVLGGGRTLISAVSTVTIATLGTLALVAVILALRKKDDIVD